VGVGSLRVLDLGSGDRDLSDALARHGARPRALVATDLLIERLRGNPHGRRVAADGRRLPFRDGSFDAVVQCTVLSSVRAAAARRVLAAEMLRVCRPGGVVLSYDARLPNPFNRQVRRVARREHRSLFAGCRIAFRSLTPIPQLLRLLPRLAGPMGRVAPLRAFDLATVEAPASLAPVASGVPS
jgi:SAM-dependent methyltransferase